MKIKITNKRELARTKIKKINKYTGVKYLTLTKSKVHPEENNNTVTPVK